MSYVYSKGFSSEQMEEISNKISKMGEMLGDLREFLLEIGLEHSDVRKIPFLGELNTSLNAGVEDLPEYIREKYNCQTFEDWKDRQEIFEDEDVMLVIHFDSGHFVEVEAQINLGTGVVICDSSEMTREDIREITFVLNGDSGKVCLDCGEGILNESDNCSYCG